LVATIGCLAICIVILELAYTISQTSSISEIKWILRTNEQILS